MILARPGVEFEGRASGEIIWMMDIPVQTATAAA
jgi:hypothetical protein